MTRQEQEKFITELIDNVKKEILEKSKNFPEEWDGVELRQYISDCFSMVVMTDIMTPQRKKNYRNTIYISNL